LGHVEGLGRRLEMRSASSLLRYPQHTRSVHARAKRLRPTCRGHVSNVWRTASGGPSAARPSHPYEAVLGDGENGFCEGDDAEVGLLVEAL
jgi:hypothetical protein